MAAPKRNSDPIPRSVTRSLLKHGARGAKKVVVLFRNGVPNRVMGYEKHQESAERAKRVRPWEYRAGRAKTADPLGAMEGKVVGTLSRDAIYE